MRKVFTGLAVLLMAAILVQFYLAASGAFNSAPTEEAFLPHRTLGFSILGLAVVLTIFAAVARMPGRVIGMSGLIVGLVLVQSLIREVSKAFGDGSTVGHFIFGLHAVNGLLIMGVGEEVLRRSRQKAQKSAETGQMVS